MTRVLPWVRVRSGLSRGIAEAQLPTTRRRRARQSPAEDAAPSTHAAVNRKIHTKEGEVAESALFSISDNPKVRSPSTSPPPVPPQEEFMHDGLDEDDAYMMVEDEFITIAKSFTQHLHHAEYLRLKNIAKTRNSSTIQTISRPISASTESLKSSSRRRAAMDRSRRQSDVIAAMRKGAVRAKGEDDDSDLEAEREDDPWVGTSLQSLMTRPRRSQHSLSGVAQVRSGSRAKAGLPQAPSMFTSSNTHYAEKSFHRTNEATMGDNDTTASGTDDDDLDAPAHGGNFPSGPSTDVNVSDGGAIEQRWESDTDPTARSRHESSSRNLEVAHSIASSIKDARSASQALDMPTSSSPRASRRRIRHGDVNTRKTREEEEIIKAALLREVPSLLL
ncbi:MAG: hypothetical protein M1833_005489 [Piccolia ochrophora]|nr:MAG: hypothetical protein M1833_005489 [Piccolia ochrophora]